MRLRVRHYFAYGSNMNPARMRERGVEFLEARGARLADMRLVFDKQARHHPGAGHANICRAPGSTVEGVLYRLLDADDIRAMDPFERAPWNYGRDAVLAEADGRPVAAWTYFANLAVRRPGLKPPAEYLQHLLAGRPWLSADYFSRLAAWPVAPPA